MLLNAKMLLNESFNEIMKERACNECDETHFPSVFALWFKGENWKISKLCGHGTFSNCYKITNKRGENLALKVYKAGAKYELSFKNEVQLLSDVKMYCKSGMVQNVVNYIHSCTILERNCLILDFLTFNLNQILLMNGKSQISMNFVNQLFIDMLSAVKFLSQSLAIIHADIKPSNVLWNGNKENFELADFSLSFNEMKGPNLGQQLQSSGFQAPEVIWWNNNIKQGRRSRVADELPIYLDSSIDLWSIGAVITFVFTGKGVFLENRSQQPVLICSNCKNGRISCLNTSKIKTVFENSFNGLPHKSLLDLVYFVSGLLNCYPRKRFSPSYVLKNYSCAFERTRADVKDLLLLPCRVLRFVHILVETLREDIEDVLSDIKEECLKFGEVVSLKISQELGNVYVQFNDVDQSSLAQKSLTGRYFDGKVVVTTFFPVEFFYANNFY